jgi:16S rRNA G966 N2-methylase RsmD
MTVIRIIKGQYTLLNLTTLKEKEYRSTQLKEFLFNPARVSPLDVARKDSLEFFVEIFLHRTRNTNRLSSPKLKS